MSILVTKADGTTEAFDQAKLERSLKRAGASAEVAVDIVEEITKELYSGITTNELYRRAFAHLREHRRGVAARYSLKRAILQFGPSGFPFEAYLAELFRAEGYTAEIDQLVQGACVEHEVDVVMTKEKMVTYVEAKFHNTAGFKTDLKTVLYVKARIDDISAAAEASADAARSTTEGLVVTNTKFTSVAIQYATCQGLWLLGWEYPQEGNLHDRIDAAKLYPITALTTLSKREKTALLSEKKVLCSALSGDSSALVRAGIAGRRADAVLEEVGALCVPGKDI
ncbi:MAG: ATP cone domain-containing protein [bacterium]|nr:ATP cone domain-containing protein [bacterium]